MTITANATHTVGVETVTPETQPYVPAQAGRAVVERYDGRLVKVVVTDADRLHSTLEDHAKGAAHIYGADYTPAAPVGDVLLKMARLVHGPYNASLPEALHLATRDPDTTRQVVRRLADTLRRHPRDLPLWSATRPRDQVAAILRIAAQGVTR
ncbi:hypothetical protein ACWEPC_27320 [Nonomuraea sp. NPDC004297]